MATATQESAFVMYSARAAIAGGLLHIEEQVKALESAVVENTGLAFDLAKTLVESACKTIITERGRSFEKDDDLGKVFKTASHCVPFLPVAMASDGDARKSLQQTLSGLNTALQGVCELRNAFGFASHGSDAPRPAMEAIQALLAAQAADAMIGFLYRVHQADLSRPTPTRLEFGDHAEFDEWIDQENKPIQIFALPPYRPSEVLYAVDLEAYRDLLADYTTDDQDEQGPPTNGSDAIQ
jgi:hypothetical protein